MGTCLPSAPWQLQPPSCKCSPPSPPPSPALPSQNCAYFQGARCEESERYPGLWQVPLLEMEQPGGELVAVMDPGQQAEGGLGYGANVTEAGLSADALEELLRTNFDFRWGRRVVGCGWRG